MQAQQNPRQAASLTVAYSADDEFDQDSMVSLHDFKDLERKAEAPVVANTPALQEERLLPLFSGFGWDLSVRENAQGKAHCRRQYE